MGEEVGTGKRKRAKAKATGGKKGGKPAVGDASASETENASAAGSDGAASSSSSEGSVEGDEGVGGLGGEWPAHFPHSIFGMPLKAELRLGDARGNNYIRFRIRCDNPLHGDCKTSRSILKEQDLYGPRAAEGYLGAWLAASGTPGMDGREHSLEYRPSPEAIRKYLEEHEEPTEAAAGSSVEAS